ncbi:hypothetical protein EUGRSUZ_C01035 [Eucalyptus grandis]|uniref:chlorophyll(ide) b reductase n=2 Tax=Eucalyptus grandis TaxID=71139 RepID=A0A059CNA3_EUCGR|nr:hypothetical protein EUGRSUZ_C01035 [Eucalyptus grandis]
MATVTELHLCSGRFDRQFVSFRGNPRVFLPGFCHTGSKSFGQRSRLCVRHRCRSFRSEEDGDRERDGEKSRDDEVEVEVENERGGVLESTRTVFVGVSQLGSKLKDDYNKSVAELEKILSAAALQIGRYIITMMSTGVILAVGFQMSGGDSQLDTLIWYSWLGGVIIGTMIGANMVLDEHCRAGPRNVVITGSTRGLGKALAREFLLSGDRVIIASRSPESVDMTVKELEQNLMEVKQAASDSSKTSLAHAKVVGIPCDVCNPENVQNLANFAISELGSIDIWINNAGINKGFRPLLQFSDEDIQQIVSTNLVGSILCTREAMRVMKNQAKGGHVFNMDGAGSGGSSTPLTAVYGSTKCGLRQLQSSLLKECKRSKVGVHTASPGMVLTDLLLRGGHCTLQRPTDFATGPKIARGFLSPTQWRCTLRTLGCRFFRSPLFAPSSFFPPQEQAAHFQARNEL